VRDDHRLVAIRHSDVHLRAADQLLSGQQLVVGEHLAIPGGLRDLHLGGHRQRHRTGGHHPPAQPSRGRDGDPPTPPPPRPSRAAASTSTRRCPCSSFRSPSRVATTPLFISTTQRCNSATYVSDSWASNSGARAVKRRVFKSTRLNSSSTPKVRGITPRIRNRLDVQ